MILLGLRVHHQSHHQTHHPDSLDPYRVVVVLVADHPYTAVFRLVAQNPHPAADAAADIHPDHPKGMCVPHAPPVHAIFLAAVQAPPVVPFVLPLPPLLTHTIPTVPPTLLSL